MLEIHLKRGDTFIVEDDEGARVFQDWLNGETDANGAMFDGYNSSKAEKGVDPTEPTIPIWLPFSSILYMTLAAEEE